MKSDIGVIGLGVMGKNIAKNMLSRGFKVSGYNRSFAKTKDLMGENIAGFSGHETLSGFVASLSVPRKVFLMVPAGKSVDDTIGDVLPFLERGDIIMDAGNSYFMDTNRREAELNKIGINYFGVGVSGGEEGALKGPSIMPSGNGEVYAQIKNILESISAKKGNDACCVYIGPQGSGHYVKMVHNGIEYADMQLLAEVYLILKSYGYSNSEIAKILTQWNETEVESYLVRITAHVLKEKDHKSTADMIDIIEDVAGNKGTGRWTSIEALQQECNASLLDAAYVARIMSNEQQLRKDLNQVVSLQNDAKVAVEELRKAYSLAKTIAFAQGFALYKSASDKYNWNLDLKAIAGVFRAGCIIQAHILQEIMSNYQEDTQNILTLDVFKNRIVENFDSLKKVVIGGINSGLAIPVFTNALTYINQISSDLLGANMIQAQRDFFGAHTYVRTDNNEVEHHIWGEL